VSATGAFTKGVVSTKGTILAFSTATVVTIKDVHLPAYACEAIRMVNPITVIFNISTPYRKVLVPKSGNARMGKPVMSE